MLKTCVHCGTEFDTKDSYHKKGRINECGDCAVDDTVKYVGQVDAAAKSGSGLVIFRKPGEIRTAKAVIASQCRAGFSANLGLGNTASTFGESHNV